jgi:hypothetical protein
MESRTRLHLPAKDLGSDLRAMASTPFPRAFLPDALSLLVTGRLATDLSSGTAVERPVGRGW